MTGRMTSMTAEAQAWRREQIEFSNDIEGLMPLDTQDQAFATKIFDRDITADERIAAIVSYGQAKDDRVMKNKALKKAS